MAEVFVSYARADQRLARRIHNALASLEIDVLWDENMPSVRWREYIENNIRSLYAVVVLWTEESSRSVSVLDEALEAYAQKKLINSMHGIKEPPPPFNKVNAANLNGWEAGKPHSGWEKVIATLDGLLAPIDEGKRPGGLIARYRLQLTEVQSRRAELAEAERENKQRLRRQEKAERDCASAEKKLQKAESEAVAVKAMGTSSKVMAAAMGAAQSEIDEAQEAFNVAKDRFSDIEAEIEQADYKLEEQRKNLAGYLAMIGGDVDGDAEEIFPIQSGTGREPEPVDTERQPEQVPAPEPVSTPRPKSAFLADTAPKKVGGFSPTLAVGAAVSVVVVIGLISAALGLFAPAPMVESDTGKGAQAVAPKAEVPVSAQVKATDITVPSEPQWLLGQQWAVNDGRKGCLRIGLTDAGRKLSFDRNGVSFEAAITKPDDGRSIEIAGTRFELLPNGHVKATGDASSEYSKCAG